MLSVAKIRQKTHSNSSTQAATTSSTNATIENVDDLKVEFFHLNEYESETVEKRISLRQRRGPCACLDLNCGCCAGMEFQKFKRKRKIQQFCEKRIFDIISE